MGHGLTMHPKRHLPMMRFLTMPDSMASSSGPIPKMPLNLALLKSASLVGVFWGAWSARDPLSSQQNFKELVAMIDEGKFTPLVTEVYSLDDHGSAFGSIAERRAKGKVILSMD